VRGIYLLPLLALALDLVPSPVVQAQETGASQLEGEAGARFDQFAASSADSAATVQYGMAEQYRIGLSVGQNWPKALELYRRSAGQGYAPAQFRLGQILQEGTVVARDLNKAIALYHAAAEQGHVGAQYALAQVYHLGIGTKKDIAAAITWYRRAAEQGDEWSQLALADQYRIGRALPRDLVQSVEWYRRAARQGNMFAQHALGDAYLSGLGVDADRAKAVAWYRLAAESGNPTSKRVLADLEAETVARADRAGASPAAETFSTEGAATKNPSAESAAIETPAIESAAAENVAAEAAADESGAPGNAAGKEVPAGKIVAVTPAIENAATESVAAEPSVAEPSLAENVAAAGATERKIEPRSAERREDMDLARAGPAAAPAKILAAPTDADRDRAGEPVAATQTSPPLSGPPLSGPPLSGPPTSGPSDDRETVARLLRQADGQVAKLALTTPAGDNAFETYQEILAVEPTNDAALAGIRELGVKYVDLANLAAAQGDLAQANRYAEKAEQLAPADPRVRDMALAPEAAPPSDDAVPRVSDSPVEIAPPPPVSPLRPVATAPGPADSDSPEVVAPPVPAQRPAAPARIQMARLPSASSSDVLDDADDLVYEPHKYEGFQVAVTGPIVRFFWRYRLISQSGQNNLVIDVEDLAETARAKLDAAFEEVGAFGQLRARVEGTIERQGFATYHLAAREVALLGSDPEVRDSLGDKTLSNETLRDELDEEREITPLVVPVYPGTLVEPFQARDGPADGGVASADAGAPGVGSSGGGALGGGGGGDDGNAGGVSGGASGASAGGDGGDGGSGNAGGGGQGKGKGKGGGKGKGKK